jgi:hypothetical protein
MIGGFESRQRLVNFLFATVLIPALGPTHLPTQWVPVDLSLGVKRLRRKDDPSYPSSADVKNAWGYTSIPPICLHGVMLKAYGLYLFYLTLPLYILCLSVQLEVCNGPHFRPGSPNRHLRSLCFRTNSESEMSLHSP